MKSDQVTITRLLLKRTSAIPGTTHSANVSSPVEPICWLYEEIIWKFLTAPQKNDFSPFKA